MSDINPFVDSSEKSQEAVRASGIVMATVEDVSDDESMVAVSNVGKEAKYPARLPEESATPPIGSSVLVNTASSGQPFVQQTVETPEGTSLGGGDSGPTTYVQDTRPAESDASLGDHWLDVIYYESEVSWSVDGSHRTTNMFVDGNSLYAANITDDILYSYDISDGSVNWQFTGASSITDMYYDGTNIYVTDFDTPIYSVDASDGSQNWSTSFTNRAVSITHDGSSVYVTFEDFDNLTTLRSLSDIDGSVNWTYEGGSGPNEHELLVDSSAVYYHDGADVLHSVDKSAGSANWTVSPFSTEPSAYFADDSSYIYIGGDSTVYALDKTDGSTFWTNTDVDQDARTVRLDSGYLYVGANGLWKLDKSDGSTVWSKTTVNHDDSISFGPSGEIVTSTDHVYAQNGDDGFTYKLTKAGDEVWQCEESTGSSVTMNVASDTVFVASGDLYAVNDEIVASNSQTHVFDGTYWSQIFEI